MTKKNFKDKDFWTIEYTCMRTEIKYERKVRRNEFKALIFKK